ncbi:HWE histidine kinase domain-containing protein [Pseudomonas sp.]|uniref:HWE histidine kinase domain-containing protein n=1 Tax=Pseudomonas sp. TaxID=306 RepID=UPI0028B118E7|nr:HWE histidine kinase domain-containing protein [Pseudomonas sp.]
MRVFLNHFRDKALEMMATGAPVQALLAEFTLALQAQIPDVVVGVNVLDSPGNTFRHAIFPDMPATFTERLVGNPISLNRGSCGRAVATASIVDVPVVATDERFCDEWKTLFREHGLTSLMSVPAISSDGQVQGSIAIAYPLGAPPNEEQRTFLSGAAALCALLCRYSRTQDAQALLIGELEHRMRNLFSTLSGIAVLTLRSHPEPAQFRRMLEQRMVMMQRAQAMALAPKEMQLSTLLGEVLSPYSDHYSIQFTGPPLLLAGEAAAALAMVVHELGTNAAKYGALSKTGGELHISWQTQAGIDDSAAEGFRFDWQERNGPVVLAPSRKGYGTVMVNGALRNAFDGAAAFSYAPEGFACRISAPLSARLGRAKSGCAG